MAKILGIDFAPLNIPLERRLQTASILFWTYAFLGMGLTCSAVNLYLFFCTKYWYLSVIYFVWYLMDRNTSERGGRRSTWVRNWAIWKHMRDYFPIRLIKTAELNPNKNYVCGYHPHGFSVIGNVCAFCTEALDFAVKFPKIRPTSLTIEGNFWHPLYREFLMAMGICSVSRKSIHWLLTKEGKGNMIVIVIGGNREMLNTGFGPDVKLLVGQRKGFVKIAVTHGASLLPVFSFGENDIYSQVSNPEGSILRRIQEFFNTHIGLPLPLLIFGRGIFQYTFGLLAYRKPVDVFVGKPIDVEKIENPTEEDINHYHNLYIEGLTKLFEEHKVRYDFYKNAKLIIDR